MEENEIVKSATVASGKNDDVLIIVTNLGNVFVTFDYGKIWMPIDLPNQTNLRQ